MPDDLPCAGFEGSTRRRLARAPGGDLVSPRALHSGGVLREESKMTAAQCRIAGFAFVGGAVICSLYSWSTYRESAKAIASMEESPLFEPLAKAVEGFGGKKIEPAMTEAGRASLYVGAVLLIGAFACFRMAQRARD
jgi:hypothetical protein